MADSVNINFSNTLDQVESLINQGIAEAQSNLSTEGEDTSASSVFSQVQAYIQQGINEARSNVTGEEGNTSVSSTSTVNVEQSNTTEQGLSEVGQQQVVANLDSDTLTNPSGGNSNGASSNSNSQESEVKPVFDEASGKVTLELNGQTVELFTFNSDGSVPSFGSGGSSSGGGGNPFGGGGENSFGGGSSSGGGSNPFGGGGENSFGGGGSNPFGGSFA
jgi:hypothetical protein